jgi:hypothetical protein
MGYYDDINIDVLSGKTLVRAEKIGEDVLEFEDTNGDVYQLYHHQDCCESVYIEDINGDLADLLGTPIIVAEEVSNLEHALLEQGPLNDYDESYTWTYYKLHTIKGGVHIRWYGVSNGYYSERVSFRKVGES